MSPTNTTRWIGIGLLGLPLYGALTFGTLIVTGSNFGEQVNWATVDGRACED